LGEHGFECALAIVDVDGDGVVRERCAGDDFNALVFLELPEISLLDYAGAPVSKDALMEAAWPGLAVEERLKVVIAKLLRHVSRPQSGCSSCSSAFDRSMRTIAGPTTRQGRIIRTA
jgi:hypothetical protein